MLATILRTMNRRDVLYDILSHSYASLVAARDTCIMAAVTLVTISSRWNIRLTILSLEITKLHTTRIFR